MGLEKDLPPGEQLLPCFRPFMEHLAASTLSRKTIRKHMDNLWVLGGEIIRDLNVDPSLRKIAAERLLFNLIHEDGGPLIHGCSEEEQRSFDSTCRKLHRFLSQRRPDPASYPQIPRTRLRSKRGRSKPSTSGLHWRVWGHDGGDLRRRPPNRLHLTDGRSLMDCERLCSAIEWVPSPPVFGLLHT